MSALTVTAVAWIPIEPVTTKHEDPITREWKIRAEVSVTDADDGDPVASLPKGAWVFHVMSSGGGLAPVGAAVVAKVELVSFKAPGFYVVDFEPTETFQQTHPATLGIAVTRPARQGQTPDRGQVVVPIAAAWTPEYWPPA